MENEEKNEVYTKISDYPQIIKGVEEDSKNLIKTQNEIINEQFGNMRNKITKSLDKLHLGVIHKTVDQVVQQILVNDLQKLNDNINAEFMEKFDSLLENLIGNVNEIVFVGKVLDTFDKVSEYLENYLYNDALSLLDLTIEIITQSSLEDFRQKLIDRRSEVLKLQKDYVENSQRLIELEEKLRDSQKKYHLNLIIKSAEEIIRIAPLVGKKELLDRYSPILANAEMEKDEIRKDIIIANEDFELLVNEGKIVDAHKIVNDFKKKWALYLKFPPVPLIKKLISKEETIWIEFVTRQKEIIETLEDLENKINNDVSKKDFSTADIKWEEVNELLIELYDEDLKKKWKDFKELYLIKKRVYETIEKSTELISIFAFEEALTLLNVTIEIVAKRNLLEYETELKMKKDELYAAQTRYNHLIEKLEEYEKKFNENYYKDTYKKGIPLRFQNHLAAALNYCERIIETASQINKDEYVEKYTQFRDEIQKKLEEIEIARQKELERLKANSEEVKKLIEVDEDVLPLLDKFSVDDVLVDVSDDIENMLDQVSSLLTRHRVDVKREISNKTILRSVSGEMVEEELEFTIQRQGDLKEDPISLNVQSSLQNPFEDSIEEAILTDLIPYGFEIINIEINGKPVEQLPDKTLTEEGLELKWQLQDIRPKEKLEISYDLRRRVSRTVIFILEGELRVVKTHSTLNKLQAEGFYDAELPFNNTYGTVIDSVIIEDIIPLYYLHIIKKPTAQIPAEVNESKFGDLVKWDVGKLKEGSLNYHYRLLELYRYEEIKMIINTMNKDFMNLLDKGDLTRAVERYHDIGSRLSEYHTDD